MLWNIWRRRFWQPISKLVSLNGSCAMCRFFRPVQRRSGNWSEQTWVAKRQLELVANSRDLVESAA